MKTNFLRSMTAPVFFALTTIASASADGLGVYGAAPASLDFPTDTLGGAEARRSARLSFRDEWIRDELFLLSPTDPFPSKKIAAIDPISKKKVDRVLVGPAFKTRGYGSDYDTYRYVTFYNVSTRKEQIYDLPVQRAECWDRSELFANYSYSSAYSASVSASASIEGIGLSASFTGTRTFTMARQMPASVGVVADYTPYALKQDWRGRTFIQLLDSRTGKTRFLDQPTPESPWWVYAFFPLAAKEQYPMPFRVKDAAWTFVVEREILEVCGNGFGAR